MNPIKIFIGTDRSQQIAVEVLQYSVRRFTDSAVEFNSMIDLKVPEPDDVTQTQRTGFSFSRWAVPELCQHKGRGIYLDADMMVFTDIEELWQTQFDGAIAMITPNIEAGRYCYGGARINKHETAVSLFNAERAHWRLADLIEGLGKDYSYHEMMFGLCFLSENEICDVIPRRWNSLDYWDPSVSLLHFTNTPTQPWVSTENQYGHIWIEELKRMITEKVLTVDWVEQEIRLGYVRPSLMRELTGKINDGSSSVYAEELRQMDSKAKYIKHQSVMEWEQKRQLAIRQYKIKQAKQAGFAEYLQTIAKYYKSDLRGLASKLKSRAMGV